MANHGHDYIFDCIVTYIGICNIDYSRTYSHSFSIFVLNLLRITSSILHFCKLVILLNHVSKLSFDNQVTYKNFSPESSDSLTDGLIPNVWLVAVDIDQPCVAGNILEGIVISTRLPLQLDKNYLLKAISTIKQLECLLEIKVFKHLLQ